MKINARINANGNSRSDYLEAYLALTEIDLAVTNAMSVLSTNVLHGRNYPQADVDGAILTATYDREAVLAKLMTATDASRDVQQALMGILTADD